MIKIGLLTPVLLALHVSSAYAAPALPTASPATFTVDGVEYIKNQILVMPNAGLSKAHFNSTMQVHGGKSTKIGQSNLYVMSLPHGVSEKDVVNKLKHNPHFKFAELDRKVPIGQLAVNDPYFGSQYHLPKIGAPTAWQTSEGAGVTIAILDSGVATHRDLFPNLLSGYNFYDNNTNTSDVCGHGTPVAGTAAAVTNNGLGVAGVAGKARIMPLRIAYKDATGCWGTYSMMARALTYAADNGAKVANISYAGVADSMSVLAAADYMKTKGGLVFISAGNTGKLAATAPTNSVIVVGATDKNDVRTSFSTFGPFVTLTAPGYGIASTSSAGSYSGNNGTSFSSPMAAGVAALVMAANPALSNIQVQSIMQGTAVDLGVAGRDDYYGSGRINAEAAVALAVRTVGYKDVTPPTVSLLSPVANSSVSGVVNVTLSAQDNVEVSRISLEVNGSVVAQDNIKPFAFSWNSLNVPNGMNTLVLIATDSSGNSARSMPVAVNVANPIIVVPVDTTPPVVRIINPTQGAIRGNVIVTAEATDDSKPEGLSQQLFISSASSSSPSEKPVLYAQGGSLSYNWDTSTLPAGSYRLDVIARDRAGNVGKSSVTVTKYPTDAR